jgi:hypothetical protein
MNVYRVIGKTPFDMAELEQFRYELALSAYTVGTTSLCPESNPVTHLRNSRGLVGAAMPEDRNKTSY